MAVTLTNSANLTTTWATGGGFINATFSSTGVNRGLVFFCGYRAASVIGMNATTVRFNGSPLTFLGRTSNGLDKAVELWGMKAPSAGLPFTLQFRMTSDPLFLHWGAVALAGVDQTTPFVTYSGVAGSDVADIVPEPVISGGEFGVVGGLFTDGLLATLVDSPHDPDFLAYAVNDLRGPGLIPPSGNSNEWIQYGHILGTPILPTIDSNRGGVSYEYVVNAITVNEVPPPAGPETRFAGFGQRPISSSILRRRGRKAAGML